MRKHLPIYYHSAGYAEEHHQTESYRNSYKLNLMCRDAICEAIDKHYRNDRLDTAAVSEVVSQYGFERTMLVLANTVRQKEYDGRFSLDNKKWSHSLLTPCDMLGERGRKFMVDKVHPGLVDLFITQVRREHARIFGRSSVMTALKENTVQTAESKPHKKGEQSL